MHPGESNQHTSHVRAKPRLQSIDALRGLAMIIMALDHVRDFHHSGAMLFSPEDLSRTTTVLFFTRWITHICAPVFFFTAGLGAFLWLRGNRSPSQLSRFLWKRGLWLIFLDLVVIRFGLNFGLTSGLLILNVLWALGWSMIVLAFLIRLPIRFIVGLSIATIVLHNGFDSINASQFGKLAWVWNLLHQPGVFSVAGGLVLVAYPLVPWFAVMALGYCVGNLFADPHANPRQSLLRLGLGCTAGFLILRFINVYGDPVRWSSSTPATTVLSFLRCTKYPPSLDFLLMTLGPAFLLLAWFSTISFSRRNPLIVFGRVPLFYFVSHLFLAHLLAVPLALLRYGTANFLLSPSPTVGGPSGVYPAGYGYSLPGVYAIWATVIACLYPLCLWFSDLKERRSDLRWLAYF